jgi:adenosine deaminase
MKQKTSIALPGAAMLLLAAGIACAQTQTGSVPNQKETAASPRREASPARAAHALELVRDQPPLLVDFLARMPKGGDLHNHLGGAVYAESFIEYAAKDGLCVDPSSFQLLDPPCDANHVAAREALEDSDLWDQIIDAWSMRNYHPTPQDRSGHDHFFATFGKFGRASRKHAGDMLAEVASRAAVQQEVYVETMFTPDAGEAAGLGTQFGWNDNLSAMRSNLLEKGMAQVVARARQNIDAAEKRMKDVLGCEGSNPDAGCSVTVRYLYQVSRAAAKPRVFAQLVAGFEMAGEDPRVVGLNIVQPEDDPVALSNFGIEMQMLDYLHGAYPKVHISLHAGELALGLVRPQDLGFHIRDSVEKGHAERIGHGVDVMQERDPRGLLAEMAQRHVLVEICLTSNDAILGVRGRNHPLPVYLHAGVPVALATDDEGVARSELTWEFERAVETYHLDYATLKRMVRDSLDHSFLPGSSLWSAPERFTMVASCQGQTLRSEPASAACRRYLDSSERARIEWKEEVEFNRFEAGF